MTAVVKTMTLPELRETLAPYEQLERFAFDPATGAGEFTLTASGKVRFRYHDEERQVSPTAYKRLGQMLGIPGAYTEKTPQTLMVPHFNHWLESGRLRNVGFAVNPANQVNSFTNGQFVPFSNAMLLERLEEVAGSDLQVHHVSNTPELTQFSVTTNRQQAVAVGDVVDTGVSIVNSYGGIEPLQISAYVHRLVCTNGMVSTDHVHRYARRGGSGDDGSVQDWISAAFQEAVDAADEEVARLRRLKEIRFDGHLSDSLESIFAEYSVPHVVRQEVTDQILDQQVTNLYDLMNTITYVGSNSEAALDDPALMRRLMRVGGNISAHPEFCSSCHRLISH